MKGKLGGAPGSALWLLGHELRLFFRRGAKTSRAGLVIAGLGILAWLVFAFLVMRSLGRAIPPPPFDHTNADALALAGISLVLVFITSVMISQAILRSIDAIYTRNDLDLLLSSPLPPWRVLVVRASAVAVGLLPIDLVLLGPPLLALSIYNSPLWLAGLLGVIVLAFAASGLALLIITALFRLIGPKSTRVLAQVIAAFAGATVFLGFQYYNISSGGRYEGGTGREAMHWLTQLRVDPDAVWLWPARALTGELLPLLVFLVLSAGMFALGVYVFSRRFIADAAAASVMGQKKNRAADQRVAAVRGGVLASIVRKELRLLWRDPLLLSQIGLQIVYLLPLGFILLRPDDGGEMSLTVAAFAPALTVLASSLAGSLIWITVSAEDAPDLIASAPVSPKLVDRGKVLAAVGPVLMLLAIPILAIASNSLLAGAWTLGGCIAASTAAALIGVWRRTPASRREFLRRRGRGSIVVGLGQTAVAMGVAAAAGLGAYGYPWLALIPAIVAGALLGALHRDPRAEPEPVIVKPKRRNFLGFGAPKASS